MGFFKSANYGKWLVIAKFASSRPAPRRQLLMLEPKSTLLPCHPHTLIPQFRLSALIFKPQVPRRPHHPSSMLTYKHLLPRTHHLRFCRFHASTGLKTQRRCPFYHCFPFPQFLVNVYLVIFRASVHLGQTRSVPFNVVPNNLVPTLPLAFARTSPFRNLHIPIINHHQCVPRLHPPNLGFSLKL